jgi:hypothetical protein
VQRAQLFFYLGAREERREGEQELLTWELSSRPTDFLSNIFFVASVCTFSFSFLF